MPREPIDRGIIFSPAMVRAILAGQKTQTRRLASSPLAKALPGDRLWVRETCGWHWANDDLKPTAINPDDWSIYYPADDQMTPAKRDGSVATRDQIKRLRPSIHMPRWASRITLAVTDVRFEPVNQISKEDCYAEGIERPTGPFMGSEVCAIDNARGAFRNLWDSLHDKPGERFAEGPAIVALTFAATLANIDGPTP